MPGLGKGMYTGSIGTFTPATTSGGYPIADRSGAVGTTTYNTGSSSATTSSGTRANLSGTSQALADHFANTLSNAANDVANQMAVSTAARAGMDTSDYGDMIRQILEVSADNTAKSQQFAREQMEFQRQSDATAMAWSAQEAQKNRDWQERLSNNAHQREVKDLVKAGLNPILAANAGAYTGSGATAQGFSSSGAMGSPDTSVNPALASLFTNTMSNANQVAIAKMYTDAERYSADLQYAQSKLASDTSILNNNNSISAQKAMNLINSDTAIQNTLASAAATRAAAGATAGATMFAAKQSAEATKYSADRTKEWQLSGQETTRRGQDKTYKASIYNTDQNNITNRYYNVNGAPLDYAMEAAKRTMKDEVVQKVFGVPSDTWNTNKPKASVEGYYGPSGMLYK